jgi:hypothetical protein
VIVHSLLCAEVWHAHVFPHIIPHADVCTPLRPYMGAFAEGTLSNLIEIVLHHRQAVDALSEAAALELVDFCHRKLVWLAQFKNTSKDSPPGFKQKPYVHCCCCCYSCDGSVYVVYVQFGDCVGCVCML